MVTYGSLAAANKQIAAAPVAAEAFEIMAHKRSLPKKIKASLAIPNPIMSK